MENKNNNIVLGIIGALIGGLIATIPWVLVYVYANMILSLLAIIVAVGALKGYEICNGKVDNKLPWIIGIVSVLSITIATFVIIPNLLLINEFGTTSLANYKLLFETNEFVGGLIGDYVISLLFTVLGISGVIAKIKNQVNMGSEKIDLNFQESFISDEKLNEIKDVFVKLNATDKNNAISKDMINANIEIENIELMRLFQKGYLKKSKGNYYFNTKLKDKNNKKKTYIIWIACIFIIFTVGVLTNLGGNDNNKTKEKDVTYNISSDYQEYDNEYNGWYYVPKKDLSGYSGIIDVSTQKDDWKYDSLDEVKEIFDEIMEKNYNVIKKDNYENNNGYYTLEYSLKFDEYEEYIYYLFNDKNNEYAIIDGINYNEKYNKDIIDTTKKIADTFKWK